uniref:alpha-glucosidase n=1 Tax=Clastoptera arizonana TaxID=38151 RepID=A0A1B6CRX6_9HEMI
MQLVGVLLLLSCSSVLADQEWWRTGVFYQIYPKSFMDSDNDGMGDIKGIESKLDYLEYIGVSAVWLSPIFKSPQVDGGYDIADFYDIDPMFGTIDDLKALIAAIQARGIKILLDFVPNHTSDQHAWFTKSINKEENYTDFYVWANSSGTDPSNPIPPNNWQSNFTGPAWTWNEKRQQFYLHQFSEHQPDLNFRDPGVIQAMKDMMTFWLNAGVDGFRGDAVKFLVEVKNLTDEPVIDPSQPVDFNNLLHIFTENQDETLTVIQGWSDLIAGFNNQDNKQRVLLLEVYNAINDIMKYYGGSNSTFTFPFNFHLLECITGGMTAVNLTDNINDWMNAMPAGATASWVVGNHDNLRVANRAGIEMVDSLNMMLAMLPGMMVTYNGDEFGMTDTFLRYDETKDPRGYNLGPDDYVIGSRDPARTPLQWDTSVNAGFSKNTTTWLPVNPNYWYLNVAAQSSAALSHLNVYRQLTQMRKSSIFQSTTTGFSVQALTNYTLIIKRWSGVDTAILIMNLASYQETTILTVPNITQMVVSVASINSGYSTGDVVQLSQGVSLRPKAAVILQNLASSAAPLTVSFLLLCVSLFMLVLN